MITLEDVQTEFLIKEILNRGYIRAFWQRDDVEHAIRYFGKEPTEEAIDAIVGDIEGNFDASCGVNWDVIGVYVYEYYNPREAES